MRGVEVGMSKYVTLPYDPVWEALVWAKKNCPSYITNAICDGYNTHDNNKIDYFFADENDMLIFALRWL